ncbi:MAG: Rrf2 family transcriptional regulator, partial [Oscillospiraceae bacterium]|nr:Rrf2 family transcriptional regulator [Oscillospiraceae bacterium]
MKISTKGRYALRMMCDLAMNDTGAAIPLKDIAKNQDISVKYLEQIVILLSRAGFVKSVRGAQGGYKLTNPPKYYTIGMILSKCKLNGDKKFPFLSDYFVYFADVGRNVFR